MNKQTDYLAVATEAHQRGFDTTPVKPGEKHPRLFKFNTHPATNLSQALQHSFDYPHDDVGLVSRKGIGNVCWLDIDWSGTEEMIVRETGHNLPRTLTTSSRPITAPWRRHLCFRQTAYSVSQWKTEMTGIRDFAVIENGKVPNQFDMKGCGGGGFVVAAGCVRVTSGLVETYTITDDAPVAGVPNWLVDWVLRKWKQFLIDNQKDRAAKAAAIKATELEIAKENVAVKVASFKNDPDKQLLSINCQADEFVPKEYGRYALRSLAGELASRGVIREDVEKAVQNFAAHQIEAGHEFDTPKGQQAIKRILDGLRWGNVWITRKSIQEDVKSHYKSHKAILIEAANNLPWERGELSSDDVYLGLRRAAEQAGFTVDRNTPAGRMAISRACEAIGATAYKVGRGWCWTKNVGVIPTYPPNTHNGGYVT